MSGGEGSGKKKRLRAAFGDSDDEGGSGDEKKRRRVGSGSRSGSGSEDEGERRKEGDAAAGDRPADDGESSDEGVDHSAPPGSGSKEWVSDFDMMMEMKKEEKRKRRKRKDIDLINDNDDAIAKMIADMKLAAREDRELNQRRQPATKKTSMLSVVMTQLNKADLQMAFVEANMLSVLTDWLAPMPDKSLPSLAIRQAILKLLVELRIDDHSRLKESGIGKAVMYLYKHPRELRPNKELCGRIINMWSRPIFNLSTDHTTVSKEERSLRDESLDTPARRREQAASNKEDEEKQEALRPGDPGWCYRARVPMIKSCNYVNRPEWQSSADINCKENKGKLSILLL